jgi:hypothetical protein
MTGIGKSYKLQRDSAICTLFTPSTSSPSTSSPHLIRMPRSTAHGEGRDGGGSFSLRDSFPGYAYEKNVFGPAGPERQIEITHALIDMANTVPGRGNSRTKRAPMTVAFDEVGAEYGVIGLWLIEGVGSGMCGTIRSRRLRQG